MTSTTSVIKNVLFAQFFDGQSNLGNFLTTKYAVVYLGVDQRMIYNFIRWGQLTAVRADSRIWISFDSVKELHTANGMSRLTDLQLVRGGRS